MWPAIIAAGASLLGGVLSSKGQKESNQQNVQLAQDTSEFNAEQAAINRGWSAEQAAKQMDFQERMSNTSYQRAVGDMSAAGLNPMLAYSQGGSSTPSGAMGTSSAASGVPGRVENEYAEAGRSLSFAGGAAQVEKTMAETEKIRQETATERNETDRRHYTVRHEIERIYETMARRELTHQQGIQVKETMESFKDVRAAEAFIKKLDMLVREAESGREINQAIAEAKAWATDYGQKVRPFVSDLEKGISSAAGASRALRGGQGLMRPRSRETTVDKHPGGSSTYERYQ